MYQRHDVKLSKKQIEKIIRGIEHDVGVMIRLTYLTLTKTDINHLSKSLRIRILEAKPKNNKHLLQKQPKTFELNSFPRVDVGEDINEKLERYKLSLTVDEL